MKIDAYDLLVHKMLNLYVFFKSNIGMINVLESFLETTQQEQRTGIEKRKEEADF